MRRDGRLFLYGPFKRDGKHTALSNAVFDTSLRQRDAEWGVREIEDLEKLAAGVGLVLVEIAEMPANNLVLVFERADVISIGWTEARASQQARHCEQRITQAMRWHRRKERLDCFASLAMTLMDPSSLTPRFPATRSSASKTHTPAR